MRHAKWHLGKVEVIYGQRQPDESYFDEGDPSREGMHAIIFDKQTDKVYVGQDGMHHADVIDEFQLRPEGDDTDIYEWTSDQVGMGSAVDNFGYGIIMDGGLTVWGTWKAERPDVAVALYEAGLLQQPDGSKRMVTLDQGDNWAFGKVANEPPQIIEYETHELPGEPDDDDTNDFSWWNHRRPFYYDQVNHTVHIGPTATFHNELMAKGVDVNGTGAIFIPGVEEATNGKFQPEVRSFGGIPYPILEAISQHVNLPIHAQNKWTFGKRAANPDLPWWEAGQWGKGLVYRDGNVYTWNTNASDGQPAHEAMAREFGLDPGNVRTFVQISPDGVVNDVTMSLVENTPPANEEDLELVAQMIGGTVGDSGYAMEWVF
jgi:hypothetical protein